MRATVKQDEQKIKLYPRRKLLVTSSLYNGIRSHINKLHPLALYVHCVSHSFNLAVSTSCSIQSIKNYFKTVGKAHYFFVGISKTETSTIPICIDSSDEEILAKSLKRNCAILWIERYHSVHDFIELINCAESLDIISDWDDKETSSKAISLK